MTVKLPDKSPSFEKIDGEEWRAIKGFPKYAVSSHGRMRRWLPTERVAVTGKLLKCKPNKFGYSTATVYEEGLCLSKGLHVFVCETFNGEKPSPEHEVAHNDGNKRNNHFTNLRWATAKENMADSIKHGTVASGDRNGLRKNPHRAARGEKNGGGGKLTEKDVKQILIDTRYHRIIAKDYGVVKSMVSMIKRRESWKHVSIKGEENDRHA